MTKDKEKWKIIAKFSQKDFSNFSSFFGPVRLSDFYFCCFYDEPAATVLVSKCNK